MNNLTAAPVYCWACGAGISSGDNYCRNCGKGQGRFVPWYYKHWGVIVMTLFGLGPFSLFLVWRSPVISKTAKIIYTGLIALFIWYVLISFYRLWMYFQSLFSGLSGMPFQVM